MAVAIKDQTAFVSVGARPAKATLLVLPVSENLPKQAAEQIVCGGNMRADAAYRSHLVAVFAKRALAALSEDAKEGEKPGCQR
jgi:CO/xanthine dehydrogenase FAD-binding subunit